MPWARLPPLPPALWSFSGTFLLPGAPGTCIPELPRVSSHCPGRHTCQRAGVDLDLSSSQSPQTPALPDLATL